MSYSGRRSPEALARRNASKARHDAAKPLTVCSRCDGAGYIEICYGNNPGADGRESCPACHGWEPEEDNPRERGDDDGVEYGHPEEAE